MQVEEVVTKTYKLSLSEEDYKRLRNHFYPILKQLAKDKFAADTYYYDSSVSWFDMGADYRRFPEHKLHFIFQQLDLYSYLDAECCALSLY